MSGFEIRFTYVDSLWVAAAILFVAVIAAVLTYRRPLVEGPRGRAVALASLRAVAVSVACTLLLRPVVRFRVTREADREIVVLVDSSGSMGLGDSVGGEKRLESALRWVAGGAMQRLAAVFRVNLHAFSGSDSLQRLDASRWLAAPTGADDIEGRAGELLDVSGGLATDLASAWSAALAGAAEPEAVVLLSDGRDHGQASATRAEGFRGAGLPTVPIWAIGLGSGDEFRDVGWERVSAPRRVLSTGSVPVRTVVRWSGSAACKARWTIRLDGQDVESGELRLEEGANDVELTISPRGVGRQVYELVLAPIPGEATPRNNVAHVVLDVADHPLRVLYLEGRARWQYKFVRRALAQDPDVRLTGVVWLGGGRFLQQGEAVGGEGGWSGLPRSASAFRAFDVVILGNLGAGVLSDETLDGIRSWVEQVGGGLIVTGGKGSLPRLADSPLARSLPAHPGAGSRVAGPLRIRPTVAALEHPVTRGLLDVFAADRPGGPLELPDAFASGRERRGAEWLLDVEARATAEGGSEGDAPTPAGARGLLVAGQHGEGRVVVWFTESDWRWAMRDPQGDGGRLFTLLWSRMTRWVARRDAASADADRLSVSTSDARVGEPVEVSVRPRRPEETPRLEVGPLGEPPASVALERSGEAWIGRFRPDRAGPWTVRAHVSGVGPVEEVLVARADAREYELARPDWELLRDLADATGGRFLTLADSGRIVDGILSDVPGLVSDVELGMEHGWIPFAVLVLALALEWALRRRWYSI